MAGLFEAHVANLGKYNEGVLAGEPLSFPASPQAVQALLKEIGVDGIRYEEIFIANYDFGGNLPELSGCLGGYENLDELNHLACLLSEMSSDDLAKFEAALSMGTNTSYLADVINLAENLDCFEFYPEIENEEDLGRYFTEDLAIPAELKGYIDFEASIIRIARLPPSKAFPPICAVILSTLTMTPISVVRLLRTPVKLLFPTPLTPPMIV